jgi:hypothetical protein
LLFWMAVCRLGENQEEISSDFTANHSLTQAPCFDYLRWHHHSFESPCSGRRHDSKLLEKSKLKRLLFQYAQSSDGTLVIIYSDEGYSRSGQVEAPFYQTQLTPDRITRNERMGQHRLLY